MREIVLRNTGEGEEQTEQPGLGGYTEPWDHLRDELSRLNLLIRMEMERMAIREEAQDEVTRNYPGLALTREEMNRLLDESGIGAEMQAVHEQIRLFGMEEELSDLSAAIARRVHASEEQGAVLPLRRIADWFRLDAYEYDCLILALAPQADVKYSKLFGYLQDDATSQRPTVALALRLFRTDRAIDADNAGKRLPYWLPGSVLRAQQLVELQARPMDAHAQTLIASVIKVDAGIAQFVLQPGRLDGRIADIAVLTAPFNVIPDKFALEGKSAGLNDAASAPAETRDPLADQLAAALAASCAGKSSAAYLLYGPVGSGKRALVSAASGQADVALLTADLSSLPDQADTFASALRLLCREAGLRSAVLAIAGAERLNEGEMSASALHWRILQQYCNQAARPLLLLASERFVPAGDSFRSPIIEIALPQLHVRERAARWAQHAERSAIAAEAGIDWLAIAEQYRLTAGAIDEAWQLAQSLAVWRSTVARPELASAAAASGPDGPVITASDIRDACRRQKQHKLGDIATRIVPQCKVGQLVLPIEQTRRIRQIISQQQQRHRVLTEWNFHGKLSRGKGLNVLFAGPPGTGKTMAAEAIAGELGLDLYRIDLSQIISKYIGETEKNLRRLFHEAENSNAVLLFDEADALFGKRSEVKDSHDRHANTEVAYLLQKMEEYEGMSILATNLQHNMDEAFARRMAFRIEFPIPEIEHRHRLWLSMFPAEAPQDSDIDFSFLARNIRLSGGNIKNAVLTAAYLAAEEGAPIGMRHLIRAVKQEFDKLGKLCLREDFGPYYDWS